MKKSLFCFFLTFTALSVFSQPYGNEWIKSTQKYFKIPIGKSGIYRIDYTTLIPSATDMKLDLATVNPKKWQMFYKGKEIPIYVAGENDNVFNSYDYIEFYAKLNDAELDKELYNKPEFLPDETFSMFSDSSYYFLTFIPAGSAQTAWHMQLYKNTNYAGFSVQPWFMHESATRFADRYNPGKPFTIQTENSENPEYVNGEGFGSIPFGSGTGYNSFTVSVESRFPNSSGPSPEFAFSSVGINEHKIINPDHRFKLGISADNFTYLSTLDTSFDGYQMIKKTASFDKAYLSSNNTYFRFDVQTIGGVINQFHSVNYVRLKYARNFDLDGKSSFQFNLTGDNNPKHIEWTNYNFNRQFPLVYDLSNGYRIRADKLTPTVIRFITPGSSKSNTEYFLCDSSEITHLAEQNIQPAISFETLDNPLMEYDPTVTVNKSRLLLLTHPRFIGEASSRYLNFRGASTYANPCNLVGIQQLYNHFSYGMPHPIAISRFLKYLKGNGDTTLKFVFLVGRGYQSNLIRSWGKYNENIIPSIGVPASDNLFATQMKDSNLVPEVAIGRLTIDNASQFSFYVDKLMEHEAGSNEFWKKSVLHLAGGDNGNQASYIKSRLDNAGGIVRGSPFGGSTVTFTKSSIGISEPYLKQKSIDNINSGMQLVTFLGHGSAAVTDVDIGDTIEYFNKGKYPVFYFNGCKIGNPCLGPPDKNIKLSGESFIKTQSRGAVAFIAQTGLSELNSVDRQIQEFYSLVFHDKFTGNYTVGESVNDMLRNTGVYSNELNRIQSRILFLQGDPSIRWYQPSLPDYSISAKTMSLYPSDLTAISDSFAVAIAIENRGRYKEDSINIKIERTYPNNFLVSEHIFRIKPIGYKDTVYLYIKSKDVAASGINKFAVSVNYDQLIQENNYINNYAVLEQYIPGNGINLIYPKRFDIVSNLNNDTVELMAQALNLFEKNYQFEFEIDTVPGFNSPWLKKEKSASIVGQLKTWKVKLIGAKDSTVYYWRALISTGSIQGGVWSERSFVHVFNHAPGWSQSDFPQFYPSSNLSYIELNKNARKFEYTKTSEKVFVNTAVDKFANFGIKKGGQGALSLNPGTANNSMVAILFDRNNLEQLKLPGIFNPSRYYGPYYYEDALKAYNFGFNGIAGNQFIAWVDSIPDSTYVVLCNAGQMFPQNWLPGIKPAMEKLGARLFSTIQSEYTSYAMIGRKGAAPGWALEDTGNYYDGLKGYIELERELIGRRGTGTLKSEMIGPTTEWGKLYFHTKSEENTGSDDFYVNVHGVSNTGQDSIVFPYVYNGELDLSFINTKRFPNIYLEGRFQDLENYTPPQLKHWRVTSANVPEGSLNPNLSNTLWRDTLQQGEEFKFDIAFQNISEISFDKNLKYQTIVFNVESKDTVYNSTAYHTDSLKPDAWFMINSLIQTTKLKGRYAYVVKVNFDEYNRSKQPELSMANNSSLRYFFVVDDKINPLLDVTFDGRHITNGEIVSGSPLIRISSKDENKLNWQTDSNGIKIWLKRPNSSGFEPVNFDSFGVKYYPATSAYNLARAEFNPKNLPDGVYILKVQSEDANGTKSGTNEYQISFTVINQASSTNFYPYPNPFTNAMRFVFTLTGNEVPDYINVKIMTIQGKVVKELNKDDLGDIHIGNNITDVVWDGTDQYGDRLSNGIYLYVVTAKLNGEELKQLESDSASANLNADKANNNMFKHATGKIVLLR